MDPDFPPRAFFTDYLPTAFNIRVIYWYNPPNYWDFLEMSEKVNLAIFRAFEEQEIRFSMPARITHTHRLTAKRNLSKSKRWEKSSLS